MCCVSGACVCVCVVCVYVSGVCLVCVSGVCVACGVSGVCVLQHHFLSPSSLTAQWMCMFLFPPPPTGDHTLQGEYIDTTLGATLGISTMAAAALGNWISDLSGIGYVMK